MKIEKIMISGRKSGREFFYKGNGDRSECKGLGSGALTGTNRVPEFTLDIRDARQIGSFMDAKRIMSEIIDAIRYDEIEKINFLTMHFWYEEDKDE